MTKFEDEINEKGYIAYTNEGDSMMPLLRQHHDIMVIRKITKPLKKYDAVLFKRPNGAYVLHRIVKVSRDKTYRIVGDNRCFAETVPEEWIIGILTEIVKDGHHIYTDSDEYKAYLRTIPMRRFKMRIKKYPGAIKRKIAKMLRRKNK